MLLPKGDRTLIMMNMLHVKVEQQETGHDGAQIPRFSRPVFASSTRKPAFGKASAQSSQTTASSSAIRI
jgi:hypothetical protein